jgi:hypothetical protein
MAKKTERCIWPKKDKMENQNNFFFNKYKPLRLSPYIDSTDIQNHT